MTNPFIKPKSFSFIFYFFFILEVEGDELNIAISLYHNLTPELTTD